MLSKLYIFVALFVCYYIFSGINEPFFLIGGVVSCLITLYVVSRMELKAEYPPFTIRVICYIGWLFKEIVLSTIDVVKNIWCRKLDFEADFAVIPTKQKTALGFTFFGNSITLTPGTVCVKIEEDKGEIIVHGLTKKAREDLRAGEMDSRVLEALK